MKLCYSFFRFEEAPLIQAEGQTSGKKIYLGGVVKRKEDRSEIESGEKGIRAFSIASGDTSVLFKQPKYILNKMALFIQLCVISPYHLPTTLGRNNYLNTSCTGCVYYPHYRQSRLLLINLPLRAVHRCNPPLAPLKL
jgi:hypothetical protein